MQIVIILVPLVLLVVAIGILLFSWAVKSGQYDDLEGPAHRILYDDDEDKIPDEARVDKSTSPGTSANTEDDAANSAKDPTKDA
ncbi:cbb3-type cytochrome oxidase assembly protein CcoS [Marinobacter sp. chi1]|uniref:Cbb3-type cytochrome oxidase assembly protein CcoS n=1 Tax=Marinobacter suaedae TaxID=3057675 RepID=A0ABT8W2Q5_9GAMM|nr:cbb3-type cytochrome oxidase assembly protein CcoS [Marinobacter sp. chi1]MDO3722527.1 cbb3-type cytochrome oxidase assembly protein CcoS [Marinobacter sp. chi1]